MALFRRKKQADDEPVDLDARSERTGLRYKDILLLGEMAKAGVDLTKPRHTLYYLYLPDEATARSAAAEAEAAGYEVDVRPPIPERPEQWCTVAERHDLVLGIEVVRDADDLFQGLADRLGGDFDGWEAAL